MGRNDFRCENQPCRIPHNPLCPLGFTSRRQCGQVTGAERTIAAHSTSGATKVLPQCGQVTIIHPLSILPTLYFRGVFRAVFEKGATKGCCDCADKELYYDFCDFRIHHNNYLRLSKKESIHSFTFSPSTWPMSNPLRTMVLQVSAISVGT